MASLVDERVKHILATWLVAEETLPWRESRDVYSLVVAELMLIRTNARQVAPVWRDFIARFPDVRSLASAQHEEVIGSLAALGLRWRAELTHSLAKRVAQERQGKMPSREQELSELLPAGGYVSKAVALQVAGEGDLPVDVGIARFLARFHGVAVPKDARRAPAVLTKARATGKWTREEFYGLLDLVRIKCLPRTPRCEECPLQRVCAHGKKARKASVYARLASR